VSVSVRNRGVATGSAERTRPGRVIRAAAILVDAVFGEQLPIEVVSFGVGTAVWFHLFDSERTQHFFEGAERRCDARRIASETNENEAHPLFEFDLGQSQVRLVDRPEGLLFRNAAQPSVEIVCPAVGGADDRVRTTSALVANHTRGAVSAYVVEGAEPLIAAADDEGALVGRFDAEVVARLGCLAGVSSEQPAALKDVLLLEFVELGMVVDPGRKRLELRGFGGVARNRSRFDSVGVV
jgi:hypothetical protein